MDYAAQKLGQSHGRTGDHVPRQARLSRRISAWFHSATLHYIRLISAESWQITVSVVYCKKLERLIFHATPHITFLSQFLNLQRFFRRALNWESIIKIFSYPHPTFGVAAGRVSLYLYYDKSIPAETAFSKLLLHLCYQTSPADNSTFEPLLLRQVELKNNRRTHCGHL